MRSMWVCVHSYTYINTVTTTLCKAPAQLLLFSVCRVFLCFRNPPNSDIDYQILIVRMWSFLWSHRGWAHHRHSMSESAQHLWLRQTHNFLFTIYCVGSKDTHSVMFDQRNNPQKGWNSPNIEQLTPKFNISSTQDRTNSRYTELFLFTFGIWYILSRMHCTLMISDCPAITFQCMQGLFVFIIHQTLTWTTRSFSFVCDHFCACVYTPGLHTPPTLDEQVSATYLTQKSQWLCHQ